MFLNQFFGLKRKLWRYNDWNKKLGLLLLLLAAFRRWTPLPTFFSILISQIRLLRQKRTFEVLLFSLSKEIFWFNLWFCRIPALLVFGILVLYTALGGVLMSNLEEWNFFTSFYWSFITMTTVSWFPCACRIEWGWGRGQRFYQMVGLKERIFQDDPTFFVVIFTILEKTFASHSNDCPFHHGFSGDISELICHKAFVRVTL